MISLACCTLPPTLIRFGAPGPPEVSAEVSLQHVHAVLHFTELRCRLLTYGRILGRLEDRQLVGDLGTQRANLVLGGGYLGRIVRGAWQRRWRRRRQRRRRGERGILLDR